MQFLGIGLMLFAFAGGLFIPLKTYPHVLQELAKYTPLYGLNELVHAPLLGGNLDVGWVANAVAWLVIFSAGAVWRFRKDTARGRRAPGGGHIRLAARPPGAGKLDA